MKDISNDKNRKLLTARDVILEYLMEMDFTIEESETVLEMCGNEINAGLKRRKISEVRKDGE